MVKTCKLVTLSNFKDSLRTIVSEDGARAVLFHPRDSQFQLGGDTLYQNGEPLSMQDVCNLAFDRSVNHHLEEPVLLLGLWSYLYDNHDVRNGKTFEVSEKALGRYLGVSVGEKGFRLSEKLQSFQEVFGVIPEKGVFRLLEVEYLASGKLVLRSEYFHRLLNMLVQEVHDQYDGKRFFYTDKALMGLVTAKNKLAALIALELVTLVIIAGSKVHNPHIGLSTLADRIPQLHAILYGPAPLGVRNKQLRRAFGGVKEYLEDRTRLYDDYRNFHVDIPALKTLTKDSEIRIHHGGSYVQRQVKKNGSGRTRRSGR